MRAFAFICSCLCLLCICSTAFSANDLTPPLELTLKEAIDLALKENLALKTDRLDRDISRTDVRINEGEFDPAFKLQASGKFTKSPPAFLIAGTEDKTYIAEAGISGKISAGTGYELKWTNERYSTNSPFYSINPFYSSELILSVTQPLLKNAGKEVQKSRLNVAGNNLVISGLRLSHGADKVIADTSKAYWDLLSARQELAVSVISLRLANGLLDEVKAKIHAGALAPSEIYKAEAEVSLREESLIKNRKLISDAADSLRVVMNFKDWDREISPVENPPAVSDLPPVETFVADAFANRNDLKAATAEKKSREIMRKYFDNQALPDLSIIGAAGVNGIDQNYGDTAEKLKSGRYHSWQIGMALTVPLGNRTAEGNAGKARNEEEKAELDLRRLEQTISAEVRESWRTVKLAMESIVATGKTKLAAEKRLDAENVRFRAGVAIMTDVLKFQEEYAKAMSSEKNAHIAYAKALAELGRATGALYRRTLLSDLKPNEELSEAQAGR